MKAISPKTGQPIAKTEKAAVKIPAKRGAPSPHSFQTQVASLEPGENAAKAQSFGGPQLQDLLKNRVSLSEKLRNSIAPAVARANAATGYHYKVGVNAMFPDEGGAYLIAIVTCLG